NSPGRRFLQPRRSRKPPGSTAPARIFSLTHLLETFAAPAPPSPSSALTTASRARGPRSPSWCSPPTNAVPAPCAGLMLPQMIEGFRFHVIDMDNTAGDSVIELDAPEDSYHIAALLRDNERFGIDRIISRTYDEVAAAISAQRLHSIAGKYTGKDDPVAILRNQGIFPAPEEIISPFAKAHFV